MPTIYLDGKFTTKSHSELEQYTPGILNAKGIFETMRTKGMHIYCFDQHFKRLKRGLKIYKIPLGFSQEKLERLTIQILRKNQIKNGRVRIALWKDNKKHISIIAQKQAQPTRNQFKKGLKVCISSYRRNKNSHSHIKSMQYRLFRQALMEAKQRRYNEAILLNNRGNVVEGSYTNVFMVKKDRLYTPPISSGCLNGIARQNVIACVRRIGKPVIIKNIDRNKLNTADEVFLTNSVIGIMPVSSIEKKRFKRPKKGMITMSLHEELSRRLRC